MGQGFSSVISVKDDGHNKKMRHKKTRKARRHHKKSKSSRSSSSSSSKSSTSKNCRTHKKHCKSYPHGKRVDHRIKNGETVTGFYRVVDNVILYRGKPVNNANNSMHGFTELGNRWAKDAFDVYYAGEKLKDASAMNFKLLGGKYAGNTFDVYYGNEKTKISPNGFKYLGDGYAKDTFGGLYHHGKSTSSNPFNF